MAEARIRRKRVWAHEGVYETETAKSGTVYEIRWRDEEGKTRWLTLGPDLDEAVEAREEFVTAAKRIKAKRAWRESYQRLSQAEKERNYLIQRAAFGLSSAPRTTRLERLVSWLKSPLRGHNGDAGDLETP